MKHFHSSWLAVALTSVTLSAVALAGCQASQDLGGPAAEPPAADGGAPTGPLGLRAFVTAASYKGDLVGAAGGPTDGHAAADALCASAAKGAGLSGSWVAYLSSGADSAASHVVDDGPFYAVDGKTKLYESKLGIGGGAEVEVPDEKGRKPIDVSSGVDKFGQVWASTSSATFWTGSSASGQVDKTCKSWRSSDLFDDGTFSSYLATTYVLSCEQEHHLLCLEQKEARTGRATKKVFVTRNVFKGDLGGLAGADAKCAAAASDASLSGTYVAWLSGRSGGAMVRASERLAEARYELLDGTLVFDSKAGLGAAAAAPIDVTELGQRIDLPSSYAWTGTLANGTPSPDYRCLDWSTADRYENGVGGDVGRGADEWSSSKRTTFACSDSLHLYCFEK